MLYDITFHPKWWHKNVAIDFSQPFFDDAAYRIDCDIKMRHALYERFGQFGIGEKDPKARPLLGTDLLAAGYLASEVMGCEIRYQADNSPQVICQELDEDSIAEIDAPSLEKSAVWARTQKQIDWLQDHFGHVETYVNLMGVQNVAMDIMGQNLLTGYYCAPDEVSALLDQVSTVLTDMGQRFRALSVDNSGGVTGIVRKVCPQSYVTSNCSVEMVSNDLYEQFLMKYDQNMAKTFGNYGIHHCGATMEHVIDGYSKVDVAFLEIGAGSDVAAVRKAFAQTLLNARFSPVELITADAAQITAKVQALYEAGKDAQGGRISVSCVGIDDKVSDEQVCNFLQACVEI